MNILHHYTNLKVSQELQDYLTFINHIEYPEGYEHPESFMNLPFDEDLVRKVLAIKNKFKGDKIKYFILLGIGGDNLGIKAFYDAMFGEYDTLESDRFPKMIFLDAINPEKISKIIKLLSDTKTTKEEIIINVASKSGATTETLVNFNTLMKALEPNYKNIKERVIITTEKNSPLQEQIKSHKYAWLEIPHQITGRFSIFSAVGLFPLSMLDIDILEVLEGAMEIRKECLNENPLQNPAIISAQMIYESVQNGLVNYENIYAQAKLESLGKWYRQLTCESLGKIPTSPTNSVAIATNDFHSTLQMYLGGPKNKFFSFINTSELPMQSQTILTEVKKSFIRAGLPFYEINLEDTSPKELAKFMQYKMLETIYLAKMLGVNAFDQPSIEEYKTSVKQTLGNIGEFKRAEIKHEETADIHGEALVTSQHKPNERPQSPDQSQITSLF